MSLRTEELSASQKRYKALFDFVADSVFMVDATACVVAVNQREEQALGYPETEVLGRSFVELVAPRFREVMQELFKKVFQGESRVPTQEIEVYRRSGALAVVDMDLIPIEGSTELSVMVQLRDISERKQLEQQLAEYREGLEHKVQARTREIEETKQYLENLLENANDVIYTLDPDQCFTYVNTKVETWGYRKDELIGRSFLSLLSKRYRSRWLKSSLDLSAKQVHEVEILSQDGDPRSVTVSVSPLSSPEGNVLGVLGIARDMTETKQLEQRIRNSEKLASVGKLAAGVAHEINNPLGGILNCLYNLRKGTLTPEREEEYVASMEDGLHRVQKIVRQLLDFSQQHAPELSLTNIHTVVDRVLLLTNHAIGAKGIRLEKQLAPTVPSLMVDQHMIEQVLTNLVLNAVQAIEGEGVITIRTRRMEGNVLGVLGIARDMTETKQLEQRIRNSEKLASVGKLAAILLNASAKR